MKIPQNKIRYLGGIPKAQEFKAKSLLQISNQQVALPIVYLVLLLSTILFHL